VTELETGKCFCSVFTAGWRQNVCLERTLEWGLYCVPGRSWTLS